MNEDSIAVEKEILRGRQPRILYVDIETSPQLGWFWGMTYETNIIRIEQYMKIISIAWRWEGEKKVHVKALPDFEGYEPNRFNINDFDLVLLIHELLMEADIVIAQNGNRFDVRTINARFLYYGMLPPSPYDKVDTLLVARRYFNLPSYSLDEIMRYLKLPHKLSTGGKELWFDCMDGKPEAWRHLKKYNINDTAILQPLYHKMRGWMSNHPNLALITRRENQCPHCMSSNYAMEGKRLMRTGWRQRYSCHDCGKWFNTELIKEHKIEIYT